MAWLGEARAAAPTPEALWNDYKARFIAPEGRLVDDTGNVSHSEGQGYGMLLAVFSDDRATFNKLWNWTDTNLEVGPEGLAAWRWRPQDSPHVMDKNNATDGDLLIAWALAEAGKRWGEKAFTARAHKISIAIFGKVVRPTIFGPAVSPGLHGFGPDDTDDGPVVNLSYWVFPAFDALAEVAPELDWAGLRQSGLALIDAAQFGPRRLPDLAEIRGATGRRASASVRLRGGARAALSRLGPAPGARAAGSHGRRLDRRRRRTPLGRGHRQWRGGAEFRRQRVSRDRGARALRRS
jgi:endoglucanase